MNNDDEILKAQKPFKGILQEELRHFLDWNGCCCPNCLCEEESAEESRTDRIEVAIQMWMSFFGGPDLFDLAEGDAIGLRARIQQRFVRELGALVPPQVT